MEPIASRCNVMWNPGRWPGDTATARCARENRHHGAHCDPEGLIAPNYRQHGARGRRLGHQGMIRIPILGIPTFLAIRRVPVPAVSSLVKRLRKQLHLQIAMMDGRR